MRALALHLAALYGDATAAADSRAALRAAATVGAVSTFFTRLRLAEARLEGRVAAAPTDGHDELFTAWDGLIDRHGTQGPRFERWATELLGHLRSPDHDAVARAIATVGAMLLGLPADARQATSGEEDAYGSSPRHAGSCPSRSRWPRSRAGLSIRTSNKPKAPRALESERGYGARGVLITPHHAADQTAESRLDRVRLMDRDLFVEQVDRLLSILREYRRGWSDDAATRGLAAELSSQICLRQDGCGARSIAHQFRGSPQKHSRMHGAEWLPLTGHSDDVSPSW